MAEKSYIQDSKTDTVASDRTGSSSVQRRVQDSAPTRGDFYFSNVPDTLDLAERAKLAVNALTRCTNPEKEYAVYFNVNLNRNPPTLSRQIRLYGKFMEALALMRIITGSDFNQHVDKVWEDAFLRLLTQQRPVLAGPEGGRQLAWMAIQYRYSKDSRWKKLGEQAIRRALDAAVHRDDYCYFPSGSGRTMPTGWEATAQGWTLQGVTQFYNATGSEAALELARKLARYLKDYAEVFDFEGRFLARHPSSCGPALHFHHNGNALEALMEYALASGETEFAEFVKKGYQYARSLRDSSPLVGFFPEYIDDWPDDRSIIDCEGCCVADMLQIALWMTKAGVGDYWDDINRYLRNQFAEMQMTSGDWIIRMTKELPRSPVRPDETAEDVSERAVGTFAGWSTANDFYAGCGEGVMNCCTGNCSRALYYIWENMLEFKEEELRLHLLLNRASPWADIKSHIPYSGQMDVKMKQPCANVAIRVPEWVSSKSDDVSCQVNDSPRDLSWENRYVSIGKVSSGDTIQINFPISERTIRETVGGVPYTFIVKGNDVVSISPQGKNYPFYQRAHYRDDIVRWKKVRRFVRTE